MLSLEIPLFLALNADAHTPAAIVQLARAASYGLPWVAGAVLAGAALRGPLAARRAVLLCVLAMGVAWCLVHAVRAALPMPRPAQAGLGLQWVAHGVTPSFPSMHASAAFALAMAASLWAPRRIAWLAWAAAALVGWSRVCLGVHFPSDVLAGAVVGTASALLVALAARFAPAALRPTGPGRS